MALLQVEVFGALMFSGIYTWFEEGERKCVRKLEEKKEEINDYVYSPKSVITNCCVFLLEFGILFRVL